MGEVSFARHYRPYSLDGYRGNEKIKDTMKRVLSKGKKRPQSILLTGNTGCGKTTLARIIASWYVCEEPNEDGSPCGHCIACEYMKEIIQTGKNDTMPDITEVNAADSSGKDAIGRIIEDLEYPAQMGDWKVVILDECHKLSSGASSLLLKPLEEPPENTLFIFCTTDPQDMLDTLKNRCQIKLQVKKPTTKELTGLLKDVCLTEGKEYDMNGLRMIASRSDYVIRDSLNNLETVINSRGAATGLAVSEEFEQVSDKLVFDFYKAYIDKNYLKYISIMYQIKTGYDFGQFLQTLTNFTTRGIYILNNIDVEGLSEEEFKSYLDVFTRLSIEDIAYILSSLKRMTGGDIEANLMSFIYTTPEAKSTGELKVEIPEGNVSSESTFRNSNIQALENIKVQKGSEIVKESMQKVSLEDAFGLFNLEKVKYK